MSMERLLQKIEWFSHPPGDYLVAFAPLALCDFIRACTVGHQLRATMISESRDLLFLLLMMSILILMILTAEGVR